MHSLIGHPIARHAVVGRVLVLVAGVASRAAINTPALPTEHVRVNARAVAAAEGQSHALGWSSGRKTRESHPRYVAPPRLVATRQPNPAMSAQSP